MEKCVIYARVEDEDENLINEQIDICRKYAEADNLKIHKVYKEFSYSDKSRVRPVLIKAIDKCFVKSIPTILMANPQVISPVKKNLDFYVGFAKNCKIKFIDLSIEDNNQSEKTE